MIRRCVQCGHARTSHVWRWLGCRARHIDLTACLCPKFARADRGEG